MKRIMNRSMKGNITSLEQMVEGGKLVYDFDTTSVKRKGVNYEKTRIGRVLKEYSDCFDSLLLNREDSHLWLRCSILRIKLNNLLLERLLRDLTKRCSLHIRLLSGADAELYEKRASLLLDEITKLDGKAPELSRVVTADVERHWVEGEVHALEIEFYKQKEHKACKGLWDKLREEETRLKLAIENKKAGSDSTPPAEGMRVPPIGSPVDIGASLPPAITDNLTSDTLTSLPATTDNLTKGFNFLSSVDPDFIVLGICTLILIGGTLYFWFKDDGRDDDGDSGGGGRVSKSGIAPVSGLKELVPPVDSGRRGDVTYFDFYGLPINFYYGELGDRPFSKRFAVFPYVILRPILGSANWAVTRLGSANRAVNSWFCVIWLTSALFALCCFYPNSKSSVVNKCNLRKYILFTFPHADSTVERKALTADLIIARLKEAFVCKSIVISKENHVSRGGIHYHVGLWNENASKHTFLSRLRDTFPEFEGRQLNVSCHKGWNSICKYLLKEDPTPTVWGEESLELVKNRARSAANKSRGPDLVKLLREKKTWEEVLADDRLVNKCLSSYNSVRSTFEDLQDVKSKNSMSFFCKLWLFVKEQGNPFYSAKDLRKCNAVLYWLVLNLCRPRHLRQKQLLILGLPGTQKTLLVHCLSQFIDIYFVPRRPNDFTGGSKHSSIWVIDEFNGYETDASLLNMVLDGQKVALDVKYGKIFTKDHNVPVMLLGNHVPSMYNSEAFHSRVVTVHFFSEKEPLEAGRLASTLLRYCIWYGTCNEADGEGLKALGYHLLTESNLSQLSERAGFRLHSMEVLKKVYDRLPTVSRSRYLKWFERFDNVAKARLYLPRDEAEYAKKVAPGDLEVELIELALQVEREMEGKGPEQERRTLSLEELDLEQQERRESEQELSEPEH